MSHDDYADRLERRLAALQEENGTLRADLARAVRDRAALLAACRQGAAVLDDTSGVSVHAAARACQSAVAAVTT